MPQITEIPLSLASLAELQDGKVDRLLRFHLQNVARDLAARATDKKPRKITMTFTITPIADSDGEIDGCKVGIDCKSKVPDYRTKEYEMRVQANGLSFNRDFPDARRQLPLTEGSDDEGDAG